MVTVIVSPLEKTVTDLVSDGLSNKEIAQRLKISEGAVKQHLWRVYKKCGVNNRVELVYRNGGSELLLKRVLA
jgi:DNA-binding CsgD family transcriptional regulator